MLATLILFLCYRCARRVASAGAATAATALVSLGVSLSAYAAQVTWMGHVHSAFAAALFLLATLRAWEQPERLRRWILVRGGWMPATRQNIKRPHRFENDFFRYPFAPATSNASGPPATPA